MRVYILPAERQRWLLFHKPPRIVVLVRVTFADDEVAIMNMYRLGGFIVVKRKPTTMYVKVGDRKERQEVDNNIRLDQFFSRQAEFELEHPAEVPGFIEELKSGFRNAKAHLVANGATPEPVIFDV